MTFFELFRFPILSQYHSAVEINALSSSSLFLGMSATAKPSVSVRLLLPASFSPRQATKGPNALWRALSCHPSVQSPFLPIAKTVRPSQLSRLEVVRLGHKYGWTRPLKPESGTIFLFLVKDLIEGRITVIQDPISSIHFFTPSINFKNH